MLVKVVSTKDEEEEGDIVRVKISRARGSTAEKLTMLTAGCVCVCVVMEFVCCYVDLEVFFFFSFASLD